MQDALYWIKHLDMKPHPEGGFYKENYRSVIEIGANDLPKRFSKRRRLSTSIYYLLRNNEKSILHRLKSDELWYYHFGGSVEIVMITSDGEYKSCILGTDIKNGELLQVIIPAGTLFGAQSIGEANFSLMGCMVSPGFEFDDYETFQLDDLLQAYPRHEHIIRKFCK